MAQGSPSQRNSPTTIHEGSTDQDKRGEGSRIQGNVEAMIERPANKSSLQHRFIPLWWRNSRMMQPARKMAHTAGGVLCAALKHFSPRTQSHRVRQVEANDGPDQRVQTTNIPV